MQQPFMWGDGLGEKKRVEKSCTEPTGRTGRDKLSKTGWGVGDIGSCGVHQVEKPKKVGAYGEMSNRPEKMRAGSKKRPWCLKRLGSRNTPEQSGERFFFCNKGRLGGHPGGGRKGKQIDPLH